MSTCDISLSQAAFIGHVTGNAEKIGRQLLPIAEKIGVNDPSFLEYARLGYVGDLVGHNKKTAPLAEQIEIDVTPDQIERAINHHPATFGWDWSNEFRFPA